MKKKYSKPTLVKHGKLAEQTQTGPSSNPTSAADAMTSYAS